VTDLTVTVPVTLRVRKRNITFTQTSGVERATIHIFGRVPTAFGWVVQGFEDGLRVEVPHEMLSEVMAQATFYQKVILLRPGKYGLRMLPPGNSYSTCWSRPIPWDSRATR
jgi:hypothetical protein